jgi:hypothetical protein
MNGSRQPNAVQLLLLELSDSQDTSLSAIALLRHDSDIALDCVTLLFGLYLDQKTVCCKHQRYRQ